MLARSTDTPTLPSPASRGELRRGHGPRIYQTQRWLVLAAIGSFLTLAASAAAAEAPPGASSCSGCHAASAAVDTPVPRLAGLPAPLIAGAMRAFRAGQRPGTIMPRIARGFSDDEIAAIAVWYAAQSAQ
jgi:sulfide dehydrogenase cytochrome subunit